MRNKDFAKVGNILILSFLIAVFSLLSVYCSREEKRIADSARSSLIQPPKWWEKLPRSVYLKLDKIETSQEWYEVYELLEGTYAIYEPYQFEEAISYLVIGEDKACIIDTGTGIGDLKKLILEFTHLPVSVVNTHVHWDQIGNNSQFDKIFIFNSLEGITKLYKGYDNDFLRGRILGDSIWRPLPEGIDPETWKIPPVKPTDLLDDGMILDLGNRPLEIIHTPGHSPDSICLLDKKNRILFCGDFYYSGPLYAFEKDVNIEDYISSLEKIIKRIDEHDHLCPSHNEPWAESKILQNVLDAFKDIMRGKGKYSEGEGIRRYYFGDFDIIVDAEMIKKESGQK